MDMIQPTQVEKARKIVKQYHFDGFPIISLDYAISRIKPIMDDLYDVEQHYQPDGSTAYKGILQVTYLSVERDLYIFRY